MASKHKHIGTHATDTHTHKQPDNIFQSFLKWTSIWFPRDMFFTLLFWINKLKKCRSFKNSNLNGMSNFNNDVKAVIIKEGFEGKDLQVTEENLCCNYFGKLVHEQPTDLMLDIRQVNALRMVLWILSADIMICINTIYTYVPTEFLKSRYLFKNVQTYFKANNEYKSMPCFWGGFWKFYHIWRHGRSNWAG